MRRLIVLVALLFASPAWGAITFDAYTFGGGFVGASTLEFSHTIGGGCANPYLVVAVHVIGSANHDSVIADFGSLTQISSTLDYNDGDDWRLSLWGIAGATGTQNITVTLDTTTAYFYAFARSYCGVKQSGSLGTAVGETDNSVDVTSAAGELVIDAAFLRSPGTLSATGGQTEQFNEGLEFDRVAGSDKAGSSTTTMSWNNADAVIAVPLKPAVAATASVKRKPILFQ